MQPQKVTDLDVAFGTNALSLMPAYKEIPEEFKSDRNAWGKLVETWFFNGLDAKTLKEKSGINRDDAFRHLKTIMGSFEPKHEHKIAGVAYLMSQWFDVQVAI